jgi:hypothetical protein
LRYSGIVRRIILKMFFEKHAEKMQFDSTSSGQEAAVSS